MALRRFERPGILLGIKHIEPNDHLALVGQEVSDFEACVLKVRRQSGAARFMARELMSRYGYPDIILRRRRTGPIWPAGFIGSLTHDDVHAAAAVMSSVVGHGIGIDIEPALPMPEEIVDIATTKSEQGLYGSDLVLYRRVFSAKEAVYKAFFLATGFECNFCDIEIDLAHNRAVILKTHTVRLFTIASPSIVTLVTI